MGFESVCTWEDDVDKIGSWESVGSGASVPLQTGMRNMSDAESGSCVSVDTCARVVDVGGHGGPARARMI